MSLNMESTEHSEASQTEIRLLQAEIKSLRERHPKVRTFEFQGDDIIIRRRKQATGLVFVFTGLQGKFGMRLGYLDLFFEELGLAAVYLRDDQRMIYCKGVKSQGADFDTTIAALGEIREQLGAAHQPVFTVGHSAGGFAAMTYGISMNADKVLAFSPPGTIQLEDVLAFGETRVPKIVERLKNEIDYPRFRIDRLFKAMGAKTIVKAYAPELNELDAAHGRILEQMSCVDLEWVMGCTQHCVLEDLSRSQGLLNLFRRHLIADAAPSQS